MLFIVQVWTQLCHICCCKCFLMVLWVIKKNAKPIFLCCNPSFILIFKLTVKSEEKKLYFPNMWMVFTFYFACLRENHLNFMLWRSYVCNMPPSHLLSKNVKDKIYKTIFFFCYIWVWNLIQEAGEKRSL